jgi:hypothetical protein
MVVTANEYDSKYSTDYKQVDVIQVGGTAQTANDNGADINAILVDTAEIGAAGAGLTAVPWNAAWDAEVESEVDDALGGGTGTALTAIPWNAAWDAEVQSEVNDALIANNLDHLALTATAGADMTTEVADNTILSRILANGDTSAFVPSTDGLQLIRDKLTDIEADTNELQTDDYPTSIAAIKAETALIVADTNELQTDWANGGRLDLIVDAIVADTNELQADDYPTSIAAVQTTADAIETDTQDIQSRLPAALVTGRMSSDAVAISGSTAAADKLEASAETIVVGTVSNANTVPSTTVFAADDITEATADHYIGRIVIWTSGALIYQATDITDYALDTGEGKFTVTAMTEAPANNDTFVIV